MKLRQAKKILRLFVHGGLESLDQFGTRRNLRARLRWRKWRLNIQRQCDHKHWRSVYLDGRCCSCGYQMFDPGD
jgi:hypothetical protein